MFVPEYGTTVEIPVQYGLDKGVKRQLVVSEDYMTGGPLYPGSEYYYAVTAYNYNAEPPLIEDKSLETALTPIYVRLQDAAFGTRYTSSVGSDLEITHTGSNGNINNRQGGLVIRTIGADAGDIFVDSKDDITIRVHDTDNAITCIGDGAVTLHYNGGAKLATSNTGVTITGTAVATTFSGSGASLTSLPAANLTGTLPAISGANLTNLPADTPTNSDIQVAYTVTANGSSAYRFAGNGVVLSLIHISEPTRPY